MDFSRKFNCLVIDDSRAAAVMIRQKVRALVEGEVFTARDLAEALPVLRGHIPIHVCFVDVQMPPPGGFDIAVRLGEEFPSIHRIMCSANDDVDNMATLKRLKIPFFLPKPVDPNELAGIFQVIETFDFFVSSAD